jgi:two-component system, NtrC family, nitrogen regulation response regulator NtrX
MGNEQIRILVVDDELPIREVLSASLRDEGFQVAVAQDGEAGLHSMREFRPNIVLLDIWMPGRVDGLEVLKKAREEFPQIEFLMISGHGTIETAVRATKFGAWDFIEKPLSMDKIQILIGNIIQYQSERSEKENLLSRLRRNIAIVGDSAGLVSVKQLISRVSSAASWILIEGETGSGKELVAQNIHYLSPRAGRPFVEINCANLAEDLIETELFGFEKGSFPGAEQSQKGKFELAQGGTIFLDELSALSLTAQDRLLRVLKEKKFQRLGGGSFINVDVRVIAASTLSLEDQIRKGLFREDLYHRLNVVTVKVPPLREHIEDIPALTRHFADISIRESGFLPKRISEAALKELAEHKWPGNVRELKNFIERLYILTPGDFIDAHDLRFAGLHLSDANSGTGTALNFRDARSVFEKDYLVQKIEENLGNISRTAEAIGLERSYLHRKIKAYGIAVHKDQEI